MATTSKRLAADEVIHLKRIFKAVGTSYLCSNYDISQSTLDSIYKYKKIKVAASTYAVLQKLMTEYLPECSSLVEDINQTTKYALFELKFRPDGNPNGYFTTFVVAENMQKAITAIGEQDLSGTTLTSTHLVHNIDAVVVAK